MTDMFKWFKGSLAGLGALTLAGIIWVAWSVTQDEKRIRDSNAAYVRGRDEERTRWMATDL